MIYCFQRRVFRVLFLSFYFFNDFTTVDYHTRRHRTLNTQQKRIVCVRNFCTIDLTVLQYYPAKMSANKRATISELIIAPDANGNLHFLNENSPTRRSELRYRGKNKKSNETDPCPGKSSIKYSLVLNKNHTKITRRTRAKFVKYSRPNRSFLFSDSFCGPSYTRWQTVRNYRLNSKKKVYEIHYRFYKTAGKSRKHSSLDCHFKPSLYRFISISYYLDENKI